MKENNKPKVELIEEVERMEVPTSPTKSIKIPYEVSDEFGNVATLYRREYVTVEQLDAQIDQESARHQLTMDELLAKKDAITEK